MHPPKLWSRLAATAAGILLALPLASPGLAAPGAESLDDAVTSRLLDRAEQLADFAEARSEDTKVEVTRTRGGWAFGTAVLLALAEEDAYPEGWLFLARKQGDSWAVAFDGEDRFAALAGRAPLLSAEERKTFAGSEDEVTPSYYNGDYRTGMRLPFAVGQSWYLTGGPHGSSWNSIDMAGGDQVVRAARQGTAYTMCRGWIRVVHDRGYSTDYYHLWSNINVNGAWVGAGAYLGYTGTDVTCGGSATGRHVHFSLRQNGNNVPIAHHIIGKWTPYNGSAAYQGYALHGSRRVNVGGALYNYGALGFNQGIVDTNGGTVLNKRSGPGTNYGVVGSVSDGATVTISCSRNGTWHAGRFGSTNLWNRLTDGTWISDAYLATGSNGPVSGWC